MTLDDPKPNPTAGIILVVEDDVLVRVAVAEELRDAGFTVVEANSAEEALAYFEAGGDIDLVFTDVHMPGPLNGFALAQQVHSAHPALPVIITSGVFRPQTAEALTFIPKPYDLKQVTEIITDTLGISQRRGDD